jgi:hypothetical protein
MKPGDIVRNRNAHRSLNQSRGTFLRWVMCNGEYEDEFYMVAEVLWFGGRVSTILKRNIVEVPNESR